MRQSFATPSHIQDRFDRAMASLIARVPMTELEPRPPKKLAVTSPAPLLLGGLVFLLLLTGSTEGARSERPCIPDDRYLCGSGTSIFGTPYPIFEPLMPRLPRQWKHKPAPLKGTISAYKRKVYREAKGVSLKGVHPVLAAKAREISSKCGSIVVSAVARRRNRSLHPIGRAVDMTGNPKCMANELRGWRGGLSTDYWKVRRISGIPHFHISWGGSEHGLRFAHRYPTRLARVY